MIAHLTLHSQRWRWIARSWFDRVLAEDQQGGGGQQDLACAGMRQAQHSLFHHTQRSVEDSVTALRKHICAARSTGCISPPDVPEWECVQGDPDLMALALIDRSLVPLDTASEYLHTCVSLGWRQAIIKAATQHALLHSLPYDPDATSLVFKLIRCGVLILCNAGCGMGMREGGAGWWCGMCGAPVGSTC